MQGFAIETINQAASCRSGLLPRLQIKKGAQRIKYPTTVPLLFFLPV